ncbi:MAG: zf-TFIIB domain-containing protein [Sandaracinaceae bacterium]
MNSPRSGEPMVRTVRRGTWGWICEQTGGVWLEVGSAKQLDAPGAREMADAAVVFTTAADGPDPRIDCPACGVRLRRVRWRGVRIDRCDAHGAWFDRGEIQRILGEPIPEEPASEDPPASALEVTGEVMWGLGDLVELLSDLSD